MKSLYLSALKFYKQLKLFLAEWRINEVFCKQPGLMDKNVNRNAMHNW